MKPSFSLTLVLLIWSIWSAPTNASKWQMGFNSAFKGLILVSLAIVVGIVTRLWAGQPRNHGSISSR